MKLVPKIYIYIYTILLSREPLRLIGGKARVTLVGFMPLWFVHRPSTRCLTMWLLDRGRSSGVTGSSNHPRSLKSHVVVWRLPGRVGMAFGEVSDGDPNVARRGGWWLSIPALLSRCYTEMRK